MKILADKYLYKLKELIPADADLELYDPDDGFPEHANRYDALLIRTVTKINEQTLPKPGKLAFIGSATAGFDHIDIDYLNKMGVTFARSEGCNANAVAEYVITALYKWADERGVNLLSRKVGIVGCGNTGGRFAGYLKKLDVQTVLYDPPKAKIDDDFESSSEKELLECDILTFHVPLTDSGPHPTVHMCSEDWLKHKFSLIVNTSRGGVVDEDALLKSHKQGTTKDYILDVWENEPLFDDEVAQHAFLTTPHIAGYSIEAKKKATEIIIDKMTHFFKPNTAISTSLNTNHGLSEIAEANSFSGFLWKNHQIDRYDAGLRDLIDLENAAKSRRFGKLRSETPLRNEFGTLISEYNGDRSLPDKASVFIEGRWTNNCKGKMS